MSTFLHKTRRVFYHRSGIPKRLRSLLNGRSEIWRSLGTTDEDEATARSAQWNARVQRLFVTLRKHGEKMTKEERELLVSRWLESSLEEAEDYRAICGPVPDSDRETKQMILSDLWEEANEALVSCDFPGHFYRRGLHPVHTSQLPEIVPAPCTGGPRSTENN